MRISKIKFSGFKSFVDPTSLLLPSNLTGVVGPNGCGKSNIIDAVQWVLGESSAKHLRGDLMTDVIFNGSNTRKPIGQASVELIFDNSDSTITGKYAAYSEIAIKRVISREGVSQYSLNGVRCRRRDVTGLFLGTGVGSRSYSVIEQGMISRVIEAKPEELRHFLEEAAGISKYKERRRETENRIRHTRENLSRLNDIREELNKQLNRLDRQAKAAERYKTLKQEQRQVKSELTALQWQTLNESAMQQATLVKEREIVVESVITELRAIEAQIEQLRQQQTEASDAFNNIQGRYYSTGAEISRIEQTIQHHKERTHGLEKDLDHARQTLNESNNHLQQDQQILVNLQQELSQLEPKQQQLQQSEKTASEALKVSEEQAQNWQQQWHEFNQQFSDIGRQEHGEQTRQEHLTSSLQSIERRLDALTKERENSQLQRIEEEANELRNKLQQDKAKTQGLNELAEQQQQAIGQGRDRLHEVSQQLNEMRGKLHGVKGRLTSLDVLQQNALGQQQQEVLDWLRTYQLDNKQRLAQQLEVDAGWEKAIEMVLADHLESLCLSSLGDVTEALKQLQQGNISAIAQQSSTNWQARDIATSLQSKVRCDWSLSSVLAGVYAVDDRTQAYQLQRQLVAGESIITADGLWLGPDWLSVGIKDEQHSGVIEREREIKQLKAELESLTGSLAQQEQQEQDVRSGLQESEEKVSGLRRELRDAQENLRQTQSELAAREGRLQQGRQRLANIAEEQQSLEQQRSQVQSEQQTLVLKLTQVAEQKRQLEQQRAELESQKRDQDQGAAGLRQKSQEARESLHAASLRIEAIRAQQSSLQLGQQRNQRLVEELSGRCKGLELTLEESKRPLPDLEETLETVLKQRVTAEEELATSRAALQRLDHQLRQCEQNRSATEEQIQKRRDDLESARVQAREVQVKMQVLEEKLATSQQTATTVLESLAERDEEISIVNWQEKAESVERRITRLGPINLAAIDEFKQESERKEYLDGQNNDLNEALDTLENAMRKIDRETRSRFKETFDRVNSGMQGLFPQLFGGGHAQLELTSDDLLETGVTVTARPPGKRNSSIHLLSGGEKALTAVAFVFAIFQLNPAPFCLLDEVDAPLDDSNVGRLCDMIISMSEKVQFVMITHNKITMEIANQLVGVTMHEAGVSRLVAVDMNAAVDMVATA